MGLTTPQTTNFGRQLACELGSSLALRFLLKKSPAEESGRPNMLWGDHDTTAISSGQEWSFAPFYIPRSCCGEPGFRVFNREGVEKARVRNGTNGWYGSNGRERLRPRLRVRERAPTVRICRLTWPRIKMPGAKGAGSTCTASLSVEIGQVTRVSFRTATAPLCRSSCPGNLATPPSLIVRITAAF
jgi:hypothetical protein